MSHRVNLRTGTSTIRDRVGHSTPPASGRSSPFYNSSNNSSYVADSHRYADDLEGQNDEHLEGLSAKVKILKDITIEIGREVQDSAVQLSHMNDAFSETSGILSGTFRRMNNMAARQGCRWLWYIVFLVVVFWFFLVVWWFRR
jgi:blocked-early-in-transport protein 1